MSTYYTIESGQSRIRFMNVENDYTIDSSGQATIKFLNVKNDKKKLVKVVPKHILAMISSQSLKHIQTKVNGMKAGDLVKFESSDSRWKHIKAKVNSWKAGDLVKFESSDSCMCKIITVIETSSLNEKSFLLHFKLEEQ